MNYNYLTTRRSRMGLIILLLLLALVAYIVIVSLPYKASNIKSLENKLDPDKKSKIDDLLLNEDDFEKEFAKAKKEVDENKKEYTFKGKDGLDIYCESHIVENSKATIVILHGLCEYLPSYDEMVYYFNKMGYSTFGLEHRGHGRSGRLGCDNSQVNVNDFEDYIYDINLFVNDIVKANVNNDLYLYSHSMGGLLAARYLEEYPDDFKKGILSAPMLGIKVGSFPSVVVKAFCGVASNTFWEKSYAIGEKPFDLDTFKFEDTSCVSKARFEQLSYKPVSENKDIKTGGPSYNWVSKAFKEMEDTQKDKDKIKSSVLIFKEENDVYVKADQIDRFADNMNNFYVQSYKDTKHEIYKSTNDTLRNYLYDIFRYYEN